MPKEQRVHIALGFFFVLNYCMGTGFLSIPYAFAYSGYLAAIPTVILAAFATWINSVYILEVMARAEAIENMRGRTDSISADSDGGENNEITHNGDSRGLLLLSTTTTPHFEIGQHQFEIMDLFEIFFNRYFKYLYLALLMIGTLSSMWSYVTVAGVAWATKIPFHYIHSSLECSDEAFHHRFLPSGGCLYAYYLSIVLFGVIVVSLSLLDLKEQAFFQLLFGILRLLTIIAIVVYCITRLIQGGDSCQVGELRDGYNVTNVDIKSVVVKFDPEGWLESIPIIFFAFLFVTGVPSFVHPIKQKHHLGSLFVIVVAVVSISYMSVGLAGALWFRANIQENCAQNWAVFTHRPYSIPLQILSYYIVLFPTIDVISVYPLSTHVLVNSIYILIMKQDLSQKPTHRCDCLIRFALRLVVAVLPIAAGFGLSNLVYVLIGTGFATIVTYICPFVLQVRSIQVCVTKFKDDRENKSEERKDDKLVSSCWKHLLFGSRQLYMTPYSYPVFSHPVIGMVFVIIGMSLVVLLFLSYFMEPQKMHCNSDYINMYSNETLNT